MPFQDQSSLCVTCQAGSALNPPHALWGLFQDTGKAEFRTPGLVAPATPALGLFAGHPLPCPACPPLCLAPSYSSLPSRQAGRQGRLAPYYTPGRTGPAGCSSGASVFSPGHKRLFVVGKSACPGHPSRVLLHHQLRPSARCNSQPFATSSLVSKLKSGTAEPTRRDPPSPPWPPLGAAQEMQRVNQQKRAQILNSRASSWAI